MPSEVFLDTAYAIALSSSRNQYHDKAVQLAERLTIDQTKMVTTRAILLEIGNALAKQRYRQAAIQLLAALETDPNVEIIPLSEDLFERARTLFRERSDKEWGITDCISFIVMEERRITEALTPYEHFRQAGFSPLLLEGYFLVLQP
jgi:uncharacterized protein